MSTDEHQTKSGLIAASVEKTKSKAEEYARDPQKARATVARGARLAHSLEQLALDCEAVVLCVSDTAAVDSRGRWNTHASLTRRKVPAMSSGASADSRSQMTERSIVASRPAATAASIDGTTRASTGSGQPEAQQAPLCRHA